MKRLIHNLTLFFLGLLALFVAASVYFETQVRQTGNFYRQVAWFLDPDITPVGLLVGDSRMAVNVDPRRLPAGFYNFSYPGETLRQIYLRVKFALETKPSIHYLILGLEDVAFSEARARLRDATRQMLFADLVDLTEIYPSSPRFLLRHAVLHYAPLVNANQRRRTWETMVDDAVQLLGGDRSATPPEEFDCGGFNLVKKKEWPSLSEEERRRKARRAVDRLLGGSVGDPHMQAALHAILDLAGRHGVRVIGLRNPVSRSYIKAAYAYYREDPLASIDLEGLYAMLDYETLFADQTGFFYNLDHLNSRGARRFTDRLARDLSELVPANASVAPHHCRSAMAAAALAWPYNDVVAEWLRRPDCHNLRGECDGLGATSTGLIESMQRSLDQEPEAAMHEKSRGIAASGRADPPPFRDPSEG
ncbi:MAG: hypothetical protein COW30_14880 [Rhodospirillales bacterium CG15_BIG_FIL_POST_REV_8_21_14_020_66_15]|nr:MAG: hypothetical protein COW30_14880 [Rhodospirillales bacterium CG15_BIG_FIL_POST_REV_8_21_14_020_66_15]